MPGGHWVVVVDAEHVERALVGTRLHGVQGPAAGRPVPPGRSVGGDGRTGPAQQRLPEARQGQQPVVDAPALVDPSVEVIPADAEAAGQQHVEQHPVVLVDRRREVVGGDHGVGPGRVDGVVGGHVGGEQVVQGDGRVVDAEGPARGERPEQVGHEGQHVYLVQGHPVPHRRGQRRHHDVRPAPEARHGVGSQPQVLAQPGRVGEVVERDQGGQPPVVAGLHDGGVAVDGGPVHDARLGLDRAHSTPSRKLSHPRAAARSRASSGRRQKSTASPDGVTRPTCSQASQLLAGCPGPLKPPRSGIRRWPRRRGSPRGAARAPPTAPGAMHRWTPGLTTRPHPRSTHAPPTGAATGWRW